MVWWCAGWCGGHPCLLRTTATSHPFTRAQVSTTPTWPVGILWQSCSLLYTSTSVHHCTHYTGQPRMWSPAAVSGVVSCAQPGHGAIVITYLNISTIHTQPPPPPPPPAPAFSMLQIFTADPSLSSVAAGRLLAGVSSVKTVKFSCNLLAQC